MARSSILKQLTIGACELRGTGVVRWKLASPSGLLLPGRTGARSRSSGRGAGG